MRVLKSSGHSCSMELEVRVDQGLEQGDLYL